MSDHIGKRFHKFLRSLLVPNIISCARGMQCGGLPRRSTDFAHHVVKLFLSRCKAVKRSGAILFLDVLNGFDRVIRAIAFMNDYDVLGVAQLYAKLGFPPVPSVSRDAMLFFSRFCRRF